MMGLVRAVLLMAVVLGASGCASKFKTYTGPEVTQVQLFKGSRRMYLMHHDQVLKAYEVDLGFQPVGHKFREGDGRTPEGIYLLDRRNPNSDYHLSIGLNYPNAGDVEVARAAGFSPGGNIFIHGEPRKHRRSRDWTAGCIAVTNAEMEDIYAMVGDDTPIVVSP
jgi:murein L,D-transpeptidase YafK